MNLATTRGCPFHCNWCAKPIYGQRYAVRSAANVVDEIAWLDRDYAPDQLTIVDDVFGLQPGWVETFAACCSDAPLRMPFRCLMRADQIDADDRRARSRAAGCRMVWMGAESGSQRMLDAMEKGVRVEQIRDAARRAAAALASTSGCSCSLATRARRGRTSSRRSRSCATSSPRDIGVSVSYPLPGTKFYERVRADLGAEAELGRLRRPRHDVSRDLRAEFYRVLHDVVHHEFRTRQLARAQVRSPRPPGRCARVCRTCDGSPALGLPPRGVAVRRRRLQRLARSARRTLTPMSNGRSVS